MDSRFYELCEATVNPKPSAHDAFLAAKADRDLIRIKGVYANPTQEAFLIAKDLRDRSGLNGPAEGSSWVEVLKRLHFAGYTIVKR